MAENQSAEIGNWLELQVTLENTESVYHPRVIRVMIFDNGKMIHSSDFCLACLFARTIHDKEVIYREQFNTGGSTVHGQESKLSTNP